MDALAQFKAAQRQAWVSFTPFALVQTLQGEPTRLAAFRREFDEIATQYFKDNVVRQDYLMTRATKVSSAT